MVCLWVLLISLALVVAGVLRRVAFVLESLPADGTGQQMHNGPSVGSRLPELKVEREDSSRLTLADLPGPFVLAVLTSHCSPCLAIADQLRGELDRLVELDHLVVVTDEYGRERLNLSEPVVVLADLDNQVMSRLQLPGTPFAIAVNAKGVVESAQLLGGLDQLVRLLDAGQIGGADTRARSLPL